jgi:hypothetical protein
MDRIKDVRIGRIKRSDEGGILNDERRIKALLLVYLSPFLIHASLILSILSAFILSILFIPARD